LRRLPGTLRRSLHRFPCLEVQTVRPELENSQAQAPQQALFELVPGWQSSLEGAESVAHLRIAQKMRGQTQSHYK